MPLDLSLLSAAHHPLELDRRAIRVPIDHPSPRLGGLLVALVSAISEGHPGRARQILDDLAARHERSPPGQRHAHLRALALASVLTDLAETGWELEQDDGAVYALAPRSSRAGLGHEGAVEAKARVRALALAGVRRQLAEAGERRFVRAMEAQGVARLVAPGALLARALEDHGPAAVQPYLELASSDSGNDPVTGLSRYSIWKYFRYLWSFPRGDVPGRSLPFLVRDAGLPGHPVCGLLALTSPVLQLTARDRHLGLNVAWVEAAFRCLDVVPSGSEAEVADRLRAAIRQVTAELERHRRATAGEGLCPEQVVRDLCALLDLPLTTRPEVVARAAARGGAQAAHLRIQAALERLATDLVRESEEALSSASFDDLGIASEALFNDPRGAATLLEARARVAHAARQAALTLRSEFKGSGDTGQARLAKATADQHLYVRKRATQLARAARAWAELAPLRAVVRQSPGDGEALRRVLRGLITGGTEPVPAWKAGKGCAAAVRAAVNGRRVAVVSVQVADISVCGAIPPYDTILGGKLASLLALSREVAHAYHVTYVDRATEIRSRIAGQDVTRSASLLALTTTSLYSVGSAQYNRARLPAALGAFGWREVGRTRGYGTMHFSAETSQLVVSLLELEQGAQEVNSTFGEGPSERLRKLRMGLESLGLPASDLLQHGEGRIVYVADLCRATPMGLSGATGQHHLHGPTVAEVADHWRRRWLLPRIAESARLARLHSSGQERALVSRVYEGILWGAEEE